MSFISLSHANNENVLVFNNFLDDVQFFSSQFDALASKYKTTLRGKKEVGKDKFFFLIGRLFEEMDWRRIPLLLCTAQWWEGRH